jgi:hypothetical protein
MTEVLTVEQRLTALEAKFAEEIDRLYLNVLPELDNEIHALSVLANEVDVTARSKYDQTVQEVRVAHRAIEITKEALEQSIQIKLADTVNRLIEQSSSQVVATALLKALKGTILKTRPASRDELKAGDSVFVIRQASNQEVRQQARQEI